MAHLDLGVRVGHHGDEEVDENGDANHTVQTVQSEGDSLCEPVVVLYRLQMNIKLHSHQTMGHNRSADILWSSL